MLSLSRWGETQSHEVHECKYGERDVSKDRELRENYKISPRILVEVYDWVVRVQFL